MIPKAKKKTGGLIPSLLTRIRKIENWVPHFLSINSCGKIQLSGNRRLWYYSHCLGHTVWDS